MRRVEGAAWKCIVRCAKLQKLDSLPLPVPVEEWIEGPLGIRFDIADLSHLGQNVLGAASTSDRAIQVSDKLVSNNARFRFTAAHELGHITLHAKVASNFRDTDDDDFMDRRFEREADRFAAGFLMPVPSLCSEMDAVASTLFGDAQSLLFAVARGESPACGLFADRVLPHLTRRFGVSVSAAVRRFCDVQFLNGEPALPYEIGLRFLPTALAKEGLRRR